MQLLAGDHYLWGNMLNIVPSLIYLAGTVLAVVKQYSLINVGGLHCVLLSAHSGTTAGEAWIDEEAIQREQSRIFVVADLLFLVDAFVFMYCWFMDAFMQLPETQLGVNSPIASPHTGRTATAAGSGRNGDVFSPSQRGAQQQPDIYGSAS